MFVYQNKDRYLCVTFADNKPVENPEYVIKIDEDAKALYMVAGTIAPMPEVEEEEVVEEVAPEVKVPTVEELDAIPENDPKEVEEDVADDVPTGEVEDVAEEEEA